MANVAETLARAVRQHIHERLLLCALLGHDWLYEPPVERCRRCYMQIPVVTHA